MKLKEKQAMRLEVMREHLYRVCFMQETCGKDCPVFVECEAFYKELSKNAHPYVVIYRKDTAPKMRKGGKKWKLKR